MLDSHSLDPEKHTICGERRRKKKNITRKTSIRVCVCLCVRVNIAKTFKINCRPLMIMIFSLSYNLSLTTKANVRWYDSLRYSERSRNTYEKEMRISVRANGKSILFLLIGAFVEFSVERILRMFGNFNECHCACYCFSFISERMVPPPLLLLLSLMSHEGLDDTPLV